MSFLINSDVNEGILKGARVLAEVWGDLEPTGVKWRFVDDDKVLIEVVSKDKNVTMKSIDLRKIQGYYPVGNFSSYKLSADLTKTNYIIYEGVLFVKNKKTSKTLKREIPLILDCRSNVISPLANEVAEMFNWVSNDGSLKPGDNAYYGDLPINVLINVSVSRIKDGGIPLLNVKNPNDGDIVEAYKKLIVTRSYLNRYLKEVEDLVKIDSDLIPLPSVRALSELEAILLNPDYVPEDPYVDTRGMRKIISFNLLRYGRSKTYKILSMNRGIVTHVGNMILDGVTRDEAAKGLLTDLYNGVSVSSWGKALWHEKNLVSISSFSF